MPSIPLGTQSILSVPFRANLSLKGQFNLAVLVGLANLKITCRTVAQLNPGLQIQVIEKRFLPSGDITQSATLLTLSKLGYVGFSPQYTNTLESFLAAFIAYLSTTISNKPESKINCERVSVYIDGNILAYVFELRFKKSLLITDYELPQVSETFNPMDY
ncbi:hypothetical protein Cylst_2575 [Cylindrospermum stagnale PCC 7417]|uniref:Uncharacterized protein n=1 Tax=Cylindrospermum stagnale PCC 7417 TaxID=56107 RepID=K9WY99_9NOST|nr:hypothetical protein [Cylindrospermum stagnale]AFZ24781.1 hypothetical protein Cylst_2575 [Cylindrospermum stagnale PCC 7417]